VTAAETSKSHLSVVGLLQDTTGSVPNCRLVEQIGSNRCSGMLPSSSGSRSLSCDSQQHTDTSL